MANITWADRTDATTATGATTEWSASVANAIKNWLNKPTSEGTTFDDSGTITVDHTEEFETVRVVTGSTHTLTFATTGNVKSNYYKVMYQFDVSCTLTLTNLKLNESSIGTVNPIPAGTYPLFIYPATDGTLALVIQNNTGTTPGTLSTPTLVLSVGNTQLGYSITGIDSNATAGVLEYSTDNVNWTTWGSYSFGTETGNITGLTNGVLYYVRYRNSASGYNPSEYATDTETPASGVVQLIAPTMNAPTVNGLFSITVTCNDPNTSPQETNMLFRRASNSGMTTGLVTSQQAAGTTSHEWTGLTEDTTYYFDVIAQGDGVSTVNSNPSNVVNETTNAYVFANTHELVVDAASGEGVTVVNNDCYPSDGGGNDDDVSFEMWYETPATIGNSKTLLVGRDDNDDTVLFTVGRGSVDQIANQFLTDGSNILRKNSNAALTASTLHHIIVTKTNENYAGIKIYVDGVETTYNTDPSTGTYTGFPAIVGNLEIDIGNSQGGASGEGNYQLYRQYAAELNQSQVTYLYNSGTPIGIDSASAPALQSACVQENLFNNTPNADNIGVDGTNQGGVTYQTI
jgi:hypothetical protein